MIPVDKKLLYKRRLLHLLDFTIESCYKVRIASRFLFAAAQDQRVNEDVRSRVLNMMIFEVWSPCGVGLSGRPGGFGRGARAAFQVMVSAKTRKAIPSG